MRFRPPPFSKGALGGFSQERRRATPATNALKVGICRGIIRFDGQYFQEKISGALHVFPVKTHFSKKIIGGNEISADFDLPFQGLEAVLILVLAGKLGSL